MIERAIVEIDLKTIKANLVKIKQYSKNKIMAILKANAYGLGAVKIAKYIKKSIDYVGVATTHEALELRKNGISQPIVLLGYYDKSELNSLIANDIIITVYSKSTLDQITDIVGVKPKLLVAIDTGMRRLGIDYIDEDLIGATKDLDNVIGYLSHYSASDSDYEFCIEQQDRFDKVVDICVSDEMLCGLSNTDGILLPDKYNLSRIGIGLYGGGSFPYVLNLHNAIKIIAKIAQIKTVKIGESVGYERKFFASKDMNIAIITFGYSDGLMQSFSCGGYILYRSKICPIVGKICMDYFMADISEIDSPCTEDEVILFGDRLDYSYLKSIGISSYEFFCGIGKRVKRIYKK